MEASEPTTWLMVLDQAILAWQAFAEQHPEIAGAPATPGAEVRFDVDTPLGSIPIVANVPAPLIPNSGTQVSFRDPTTVTLPVSVAGTA